MLPPRRQHNQLKMRLQGKMQSDQHLATYKMNSQKKCLWAATMPCSHHKEEFQPLDTVQGKGGKKQSQKKG